MSEADRDDDARHMRRAIALARRGWGRTAPNPMVGAVVVRGGVVVGEGYHAAYGEAHAEPMALAAAGERARGATLYVTLEPCNHAGKQPPCAPAVIASGVRRVVIAARDPNPEAAGGIAALERAGIDVEVGVEEEAARELDAAFFHRFASDRPWVTLKLALSLDGAITDASRGAGYLTGPAARREVHRLRANSDAVAVGLGTALADDPLLTVRGVRLPRVAPARIVFDREARLPLESRLVRGAREAPVVVVTDGSVPSREDALAAAGVRVLRAAGTAEALRALRASGVHSLLAEGGAGLAGALLEAAAVDRLIIFRAPVVLGAGALGAFSRAPAHALAGAPRLRIVASRRFGDDEMTIYALH